MSGVYLASLLVSAAGLALLDIRYRLVFRRAPRRATVAVLLSTAFFVCWDAVGIATGVFRHTDSQWATGILLAPHFPLEELLFVMFLSYVTLIVLSGVRRRQERSARE